MQMAKKRKKQPDKPKRELSNDEYPISARAEAQLIQRALRWNTDDTVRDLAIEKTREHIESDNERVSAAGIRNLIAMERMNQEDEKPAKLHIHAHGTVDKEEDRFSQIASELGIDGLLEEASEGEGESDSATASGEEATD
tara:strand:- start:1214 stop:1633 length:420 start_codon:yes stop_codon:yes gene_type:complete